MGILKRLQETFLLISDQCLKSNFCKIAYLSCILSAGSFVNSSAASQVSTSLAEASLEVQIHSTSIPSLEEVILQAFVDQVILPGYDTLSQQTVALASAANLLATEPTGDHLTATQLAWGKAFSVWQRGAAYTFGPSDSLGFSGSLESGLDEASLTALLSSDRPLTLAAIANLPSSMRGFEAIAYVLFGADGTQSADQLSARELAYLQTATTDLHMTAANLGQSWTTGVYGYPAYRQVFVTAGSADNPAYLSIQAALEEILQGVLGTTDEMAAEALPELLESPDEMVVTQGGVSSLSSVYSAVEGAYYAYVGAVPEAGQRGKGLSDYVAANDPVVDEEIRLHFLVALAALELAASDPTALVEASMELETVITQLEESVLPLLQQL